MWFKWLVTLQKNLKIALLFTLSLFLFRLSLLFIFFEQVDHKTPLIQFFFALVRGLQFDLKYAVFAILPLILLDLIFLNFPTKLDKIRLLYSYILFFFTFLLGVLNVAFFKEFHDQFNFWIFGLFHDDLSSIIKTAWDAYPVFKLSLLFILAYVLLCIFIKKWVQTPFVQIKNLMFIQSNFFYKISFTLMIVLVLFFIARGNYFNQRPLGYPLVAITNDRFLNKIIPNFYLALNKVFKNHLTLLNTKGLSVYLEDGNIEAALKRLYPDQNPPSQRSIDDWLLRTVSHETIFSKPRHIFLIVMESQDSWPLLKQYESLGISPQIKKMGQKGICISNFVSSGPKTIFSLASIISGMPEVGVGTHYQPLSQNIFPTSIALQFKNLGYHTNLWSGGYLSWEELGKFSLQQGFDNAFGAGDIKSEFGNAWGVDDKRLFDFILNHLDSNNPSFNLIMTTSNHPAYHVDLEREGCPLKIISDEFEKYSSRLIDVKTLGHFWYGDACVGDFVEKAERKFSSTLFALTGDHWSRRFVTNQPTLYERKSVPFIIYGVDFSEIAINPLQLAGSHLDIAPTLIEMIAPKNTVYYSFGRNLFDSKNPQIGLGVGTYITPDVIGDVTTPKYFEKLPHVSEIKEIDYEALEQRYLDLHGVGWWRIMKGTHY